MIACRLKTWVAAEASVESGSMRTEELDAVRGVLEDLLGLWVY